MKKKRVRYQTILVVVPTTATPGQVIEQFAELDKDYKETVGVAVSVAGTLSSLPYVDIGLRDSYTVLHDDCHIENWQASSAVSPEEKFKEISSRNDGRKMFARVTPPSAPAAPVTIQFIFKMIDELEEVSIPL